MLGKYGCCHNLVFRKHGSENITWNQIWLAYISSWFYQVTDLDDEVGSPAEEFKAFAADTGMNRSQSEYCNVGTKTYLTNHPAKKFVFDFMRVLIIDNLCLTPASKQTPLIDLLLEVKTKKMHLHLFCIVFLNRTLITTHIWCQRPFRFHILLGCAGRTYHGLWEFFISDVLHTLTICFSSFHSHKHIPDSVL